MTNRMPNEIEHQLLAVIADITGIPPSLLSRDSSVEKHDEWDSISQVTLMLEIERRFGIAIRPEQAVDLMSVHAIIDFITSSHDR